MSKRFLLSWTPDDQAAEWKDRLLSNRIKMVTSDPQGMYNYPGCDWHSWDGSG